MLPGMLFPVVVPPMARVNAPPVSVIKPLKVVLTPVAGFKVSVLRPAARLVMIPEGPVVAVSRIVPTVELRPFKLKVEPAAIDKIVLLPNEPAAAASDRVPLARLNVPLPTVLKVRLVASLRL